jgi:TPR repeat protein
LLKEQKALSLGDRLYIEADLLDGRGRYAEALPLLIERGKGWRYELPDPSRELFFRWSKGHSDRSDARAIYWYKQAYKQGDSGAAFNLAMHYRKRGDFGEAYRWFQHSVEAGNNEAHLALAKIWLHERENLGENCGRHILRNRVISVGSNLD